MKHENVKITEKKQINGALFVLECPICGKWTSSASERSLLPQFDYCDGSEPTILKSKKEINNTKTS